MSIEFQAWPKTPRLFRDVIVTEKIDGTNSAVIIQELDVDGPATYRLGVTERDGVLYEIAAQSRNRLITPGKQSDNYGFASFVQENAEQLFELLGPGRHFGEWWGQGIARKYGMDCREFSLFNTERYDHLNHSDSAMFDGVRLNTVPVLYSGTFAEAAILQALTDLGDYGSVAAAGFMNPEGICVYHTQSKQVYKVTLDNNDAGKWEQ